MLAAAVLTSGTACTTYRDDLARSQRAFEHAEYERALALFRMLEPAVTTHRSLQEQTEYAYLRGMTDYRVGYKVDARHWLALASSLDGTGAKLLPTAWKNRMKEALGELNEQVYAGGIEALAESQADATKSGAGTPVKAATSEDEP